MHLLHLFLSNKIPSPVPNLLSIYFPKLSFPEYSFKVQNGSLPAQTSKIFDIVRKKYVVLTPEEWVRQHLLHFLVNEKKFPSSLLSVEKKLLVNNLEKRTDVVAYTSNLKPLMIAECKAPAIKISQDTFDQAARYNMTIGAAYFLITNGLEIMFCRIDHTTNSYEFFPEVPDYKSLLESGHTGKQ